MLGVLFEALLTRHASLVSVTVQCRRLQRNTGMECVYQSLELHLNRRQSYACCQYMLSCASRFEFAKYSTTVGQQRMVSFASIAAAETSY